MKNLSYEVQLVKNSAERLLKFLEIYESGKESEQNGLRPLIRRETRIILKRSFRVWFKGSWIESENRIRGPPEENGRGVNTTKEMVKIKRRTKDHATTKFHR